MAYTPEPRNAGDGGDPLNRGLCSFNRNAAHLTAPSRRHSGARRSVADGGSPKREPYSMVTTTNAIASTMTTVSLVTRCSDFSIGSRRAARGGRRRTRTAALQPGLAGLGVGTLLHLAEHLVEIKAGGLLALRI